MQNPPINTSHSSHTGPPFPKGCWHSVPIFIIIGVWAQHHQVHQIFQNRGTRFQVPNQFPKPMWGGQSIFVHQAFKVSQKQQPFLGHYKFPFIFKASHQRQARQNRNLPAFNPNRHFGSQSIQGGLGNGRVWQVFQASQGFPAGIFPQQFSIWEGPLQTGHNGTDLN